MGRPSRGRKTDKIPANNLQIEQETIREREREKVVRGGETVKLRLCLSIIHKTR